MPKQGDTVEPATVFEAAETEAHFQKRVIDLAHARGWLVHHTRTVRMPSGAYATPLQGDPGFPDLVMARKGVLILAELKSEKGRVEPEQRLWLDAISSQHEVWRPSDWSKIERMLE